MSIGEFCRIVAVGEPLTPSTLVTIILGVLIGGITLSGSLVAFGKLQGLISGTPIIFPMQQAVNLGLLVAFGIASGLVWLDPSQLPIFWGLVAIATSLGGTLCPAHWRRRYARSYFPFELPFWAGRQCRWLYCEQQYADYCWCLGGGFGAHLDADHV